MTGSTFLDALGADGPSAERTGKMDLYGWLIGSWELDIVRYLSDGATRRRKGEWHFGWALEGRAIQDVWILYGIFYGTTLRVYDPSLDAWHILWSDPVRQYYTRQIGRKDGKNIVQVGTLGDLTLRWTFTDIAPGSFRWVGERSADGGKTWTLQSDYRATRSA